MMADRLPGKLFVVGTPIGNLDDITARALRTLGEAAVIAAEDTRVTAKLLRRFGIRTKLTSFREQNARQAIPMLISALLSGDDVALVTDAGTPAISDPGSDLVAAAAKEGIEILPVPGPSALASALSVSGLTGEGIRFVGFLTRSGPKRGRMLRSIAIDSSVTVIYEAPSRIHETIKDLAEACGAARKAAVMREMTKIHEQTYRGTLGELAERLSGAAKGEIAIVIEGNVASEDEEIDDDRLRSLVRGELDRKAGAGEAASILSRALGVSRNRIYRLAVEEIEKGRSERG